MKRRGPGRPVLPKAKRRAAIFSVRLSAPERERISVAARRHGVVASEWARTVLLREAVMMTSSQ